MKEKIFTMILVLIIVVPVFAQNNTISVSDKYGDHLLVELNPRTGSGHWVYGELPNINRFGYQWSTLTKSSIKNLSQNFFNDYKNILKIDPTQVTLKKAETDGQLWFVSYVQSINNVPVNGTEIGYTINQKGDIISLGADAYQNIQISTVANLESAKALEVCKNAFAIDSFEVRNPGELLIYPLNENGIVTFYLAWKVILFSQFPLKEREYFVDASDGTIIHKSSNLHDAYNYGYVKRGYFPEHYNDTPVEAGGFQNVNVEIRGINSLSQDYLIAEDNTSSCGYYQISWTPNYSYYRSFYIKGTQSLGLSNVYAKIENANTAHHTHFFYPTSVYSHNWTWTTEETNVYFHMNQIHGYYSNTMNYSGMDYQMKGYVHLGTAVNGKADGTDIYFGSQNGEEWAKSSDIIYHEYTHNTIYHLYDENFIGPDIEEPEDFMLESIAMDEALPDYFAASINNGRIVGESVGDGRNLAGDKTMDDYWGDDPNEYWYPYVDYDNSLIFSGACWDLRQEVGNVIADKLVFKALQMEPHAHTFLAFLSRINLADYNYYSGSHKVQITKAFAKRGILYGTHISGTISSNTTLQGTVIIDGNVTVNNGVTLTFNPGSVILFSDNSSLTISGRANLNAEGTESTPITFTSKNLDPSQGDWQGIRVLNGGTNSQTTLDYCEISYATNGIYAANSDFDVTHSYIHHNDVSGVVLIEGSSLFLQYNTIAQNGGEGITSTYSSAANLGKAYVTGGNRIYGNAIGIRTRYEGYAFLGWSGVGGGGNSVFNTSSYAAHAAFGSEIKAENTWWGTTNPVAQSGDLFYTYISSTIDYQPYLTSDPGNGSPLAKANDATPPNPPVVNNTDPASLYHAGQYYNLLGDTTAAFPLLRRVVNRFPTSDFAVKALTQLYHGQLENHSTGLSSFLQGVSEREVCPPALTRQTLILQTYQAILQHNNPRTVHLVHQMINNYSGTQAELYGLYVLATHPEMDASISSEMALNMMKEQYPNTLLTLEAREMQGETVDWSHFETGLGKQVFANESQNASVNLPADYALHRAYPNPFNPSTTIQYDLPKAAHVSLQIYNLQGQLIATLFDNIQPAGYYQILWDGTDQSRKPVASGVYFCRMVTPHYTKTVKMLLVR